MLNTQKLQMEHSGSPNKAIKARRKCREAHPCSWPEGKSIFLWEKSELASGL